MGQGILPQLRKSPADFGIGLASAPDSSPMAVLEGLAAALEVRLLSNFERCSDGVWPSYLILCGTQVK